MFVLSGIFFSAIIYGVQGLDCLCAAVNLQTSNKRSAFMLPKGTCAEITDRTSAPNHVVWYNVKYDNKIGWIREDKTMMSFSQCEDPLCRDISSVCGASANMCNYKDWSYQFCKKHCNLCHVTHSTSTTTTTTTTPPTCEDATGIDCSVLPGVCHKPASAGLYCRKYCKICDIQNVQGIVDVTLTTTTTIPPTCVRYNRD